MDLQNLVRGCTLPICVCSASSQSSEVNQFLRALILEIETLNNSVRQALERVGVVALVAGARAIL